MAGRDEDEREGGRERRRSRTRSRSPGYRRDNRDYDERRDKRRSRSRSRSPVRRRSRSRDRDRDRERKRSRSRSRSPTSKRRKYSRSRSRSRERRKRRDRSPSYSSSEDDSEDDRRRRKEKKKEKREKKERKREKKERKKKKGSQTSQWGKYGVISEVDIFAKGNEFHTWLVEERKINPETISKDQSKKEFARFVEDYNTATLPHEKYYNMEAYERRMSALRSGEFVPPPDDAYDPEADMKAISGAHKKKKADDSSTYLSREQLMELRKVQNERIEAGKMKLLGMDIKQNMGVRMDGTMFDD